MIHYGSSHSDACLWVLLSTVGYEMGSENGLDSLTRIFYLKKKIPDETQISHACFTLTSLGKAV